MNDLLSSLYGHVMELTPTIRNDPDYEQAIQAYMELEAEVKEKLGLDLLTQYNCAHNDAFGWEKIAIFQCGLHFGAQFLLEVLS